MPRLFRIKIDVEALCANLTRQEQRTVSKDEAQRWLRDAGFVPNGDLWLVRESDLGHLDPEEVTAADVVDGTEN